MSYCVSNCAPMYRFTTSLALFLAISTFSATRIRAQEDVCQNRTLAISFLSYQLLPVSGITPADLKATLHGKQVTIDSIAPDQRPHRIVLLLDVSGSMRASWNKEITLAEMFFDENAQDSQFALMAFNLTAITSVRFSQGNAAVKSELEVMARLPQDDIRGSSAIHDAIVSAVQLFDHPTSADAIYLISDGMDDASKHSAGFVDRFLQGSSVRLFATIISREPYAPFGQGDQLREFSTMVGHSGGQLAFSLGSIASGSNIALHPNPKLPLTGDEAVRRFARMASRDLEVQLKLPAPPSKYEHFRLEFTNAARNRWKGTFIFYPTMISPCRRS